MGKPEWRKPCVTGCTCGKHTPRAYVCPEGCVCARHSDSPSRRRCDPGCTCTRHRPRACAPGCTCKRHDSQIGRKYTDEQRIEAAERRRAYNREDAKRRSREPGFAERRLAYQRANPDKMRSYYLKNRFGITLDQWVAMFDAQAGRCYLCTDPLDPAHTHVDHSHAHCPGNRSCGSCVRGLACRWCNQGVGQFRDDPERMRRAATALELAEATITSALARTRIARE